VQPTTVRATTMLLALYAILTASRLPEVLHTAVGPMLLLVSALSLLFGVGVWRRAPWGWWGAFVLVLAMLSWLAIAGAVLLATAEGRAVLRGFATMPVAVASTVTEVLLLILLLLPSTRAHFRRASQGHAADKRCRVRSDGRHPPMAGGGT
jgi:hypothetical protein